MLNLVDVQLYSVSKLFRDSYFNTRVFYILYINNPHTLRGILAKIFADYFIYVLLVSICVYGVFLMCKFFRDKPFKSYRLNTLGGIILFFKQLAKHPVYGIWFVTVSSLIISYALKEVIQFVYFNPRPEFVLDITPIIKSKYSASFPSGHTIGMMSISWSIYLFVAQNFKEKKYKLLAISLLLLSILSAVCRICVGIHWPLDILGGIIISYIVSFIIIMIYNKFINTTNSKQ